MIGRCASAAGGYSALANRLRTKAAATRTPIEGSIELTAECNLACRHCYINQPKIVGAAETLDTGTVCALLDRIADAGCLWLGITGGEPLVRPDFAAIYAHARQRGFLITLLTNGTLLDEPIADLLRDLPPLTVEITLYGQTEQCCAKVTGVAGSLARCHAGIGLLEERGVPYRLKTTLTTDNQQELDGMRAFAAERGVDFRIDGLLNSRLDGRPLPAGIALAARELPRIELTDRRSRESWTARHEQQRHAASSPYHCAAGISAFHVDYRGRLMPCLLARRPARSLIDRDFRAAWDGPIRAAVEGWAAAASACRECALAGCCDTCPGWGLTEQGDPVRPVDRLCHVAAARARELGIEGRPAGTEP